MNEVRVNFNLAELTPKVSAELMTAMNAVGLHCMRESKRNAPRSPTIAQKSATLIRKRRSKQRQFAGGLEKSIDYEVKQTVGDGVQAAVFVPANSAAGKYAKRIHDEKGITWFKRGIGTQQKGARADEKFIERAVQDNIERYSKRVAGAVERALK